MDDDIFELFTGTPPQEQKIRTPSKNALRGRLVKIDGLVVRLSEASLLFFADDAQKEVFLPLSLIQDWHFSDGSKHGLTVADLSLNDEITVVTFDWLAKREGLI